MSFADSDKEAKWIWFDGNTWQSYDLESNHQIEDAFVHQKESIELNNIHRVYFNYDTNPPSFTQINVITKDMIYIKRSLHFKPRPFVTVTPTTNAHSSIDYNDHAQLTQFIINNHQNRIKSKKKKRKKSTKKPASLLSNIQRIQLYKHLYSEGFNKQLIDGAIKKFNHKYAATSPILSDLSDIIHQITDILNHNEASQAHEMNHVIDHNAINGYDDDHMHSCDEDQEQGSVTYETPPILSTTPPSSSNTNNTNDHITFMMNGDTEQQHSQPQQAQQNEFDFKIGAWIEVNINNNWIPGRIIDVNWSYRAPVTLTIGYQDVFNKRSKQIKLNGSDINRNRVRTLVNNNNNHHHNKEKEAVQIKKNRFNFDESDNWRRKDRDTNNNNNPHNAHNAQSNNGTANGRFNRNNLSVHKFSFEYHKNNKKYDEKNAKHPSEYINRKCFKCKGSGKCLMKLKLNKLSNGNSHNYNTCLRCKATGFVQMTCTKCINGSGIYRKSHSLIHSKCGGRGCVRCNDSGKYPLHDILCNNCKGSGVYKSKCSACCVENNNNNGDYVQTQKENERNQRYNQCMSGYRLPQLIPFVPKRENRKLSVYGANRSRSYERNGGDFLKGMHNMKRLYHATDKKGANGIIETGVMFNTYNEGIIFTDSGRNIEINAREKGYLVIADVFIGKCKDEYYANNNEEKNMTFDKLHETGCDSIRRNLSDAVQYIVYNWDQVWVHVVLPFEQVNFDLFD